MKPSKFSIFDPTSRWLFDHQLRGENLNFLLAGTDEAGRGAWAGPLVVAAVVLPPFYDHPQLRDSKKLTPFQREKLYWEIQEVALSYRIEIISVRDVEKLNPKRASQFGMIKALEGLLPQPQLALVDAEKIAVQFCPTKAYFKGDDLSLHIAAASILAKVTRDRLMVSWHQVYPQFCFSQNKGYGTKIHQKALENFGITPLHRKTYAPVKIYLSALDSEFC